MSFVQKSIAYTNLLILLCLIPLTTMSQNDSFNRPSLDNREVRNMAKESFKKTDSTSQTFPPTPPDTSFKINSEAQKAYYEHQIWEYKHRKEVFDWQLFSTKLIFWCVLLLVLVGIIFSAIQFYKSIKSGEFDNTEIQANTEGFKVTSSVLGVIILVISLAFFYLYLVYVYPIKEIF